MNLLEDPFQTKTTQFVDLGLTTINALDEGSGLSTPATRIKRPTDGAPLSGSNHIFVETTIVGVSETMSDYDYNYKTELQIWK